MPGTTISAAEVERPRLSKYRTFSGPPLTIFIGRRWMSTCRFSPYEARPHFQWSQVSLTAVMEPPMFGVMEPVKGS